VEGVRHLQMLGVKYYMALTPETQAQADVDPSLRLVATSGPWPVSYTSGNTTTTKQRTWKIYEVEDSALVTPLREQPVVMKGVSKGGKTWLSPSMAWYLDPNRQDVFYAASGPKSWPRISGTDTNPPRTPLQPVQVANIKTGDDNVSFDVDTVGVPVLVKVSYFPNWHVSGAKGPYRVTPNLMVVIPTSHHVSLHYGYTTVDVLAIVLSLIGIAGVIYLARAKPVRFPAPRHLRRSGQAAGDDREEVDATRMVGTYNRLEYELTGAFPATAADPGPGRTDQDLDVWLGFPAGLDLARYRTADYGQTGAGRRTAPAGAAAAARAATAAPASAADPNGKGGRGDETEAVVGLGAAGPHGNGEALAAPPMGETAGTTEAGTASADAEAAGNGATGADHRALEDPGAGSEGSPG
jgi:hypothetical protein